MRVDAAWVATLTGAAYLGFPDPSKPHSTSRPRTFAKRTAAEKGTMVKFLDPFGLEYGTAEIERMESE